MALLEVSELSIQFGGVKAVQAGVYDQRGALRAQQAAKL